MAPPPPLPPHPIPIKAGLERFGVYGTRWFLGPIIALGMVWAIPLNEAPRPPVPIGPQAPVQQWQSAIPVLPVLARAAPGRLPKPAAGQREPPCQPRMGEEEIGGYCWLRLDVEPPCVEGQAWERNGKCYTHSLRAAPSPQSGEVRAGNVAGEP